MTSPVLPAPTLVAVNLAIPRQKVLREAEVGGGSVRIDGLAIVIHNQQAGPIGFEALQHGIRHRVAVLQR